MKTASLLIAFVIWFQTAAAKEVEVIGNEKEFEAFTPNDPPAFKKWYRNFVWLGKHTTGDNLEGNQDRFRPIWKHGGTIEEALVRFYHPEARSENKGGVFWRVWIKPNCGPYKSRWIEQGSSTGEWEAWSAMLEWLLAYDYCD